MFFADTLFHRTKGKSNRMLALEGYVIKFCEEKEKEINQETLCRIEHQNPRCEQSGLESGEPHNDPSNDQPRGV